MFCNNGGEALAEVVNSRKRGRGVDATFPPLPTTNIFSLQRKQHPLQTPISTSLGLNINGKQQQQQQQQGNQGNYNLPFSTLSFIKEDLAAQFKDQTVQIDQTIKTHGEQLQRMLAEKYERHCRELLCAAEESFTERLREKDEEIEKVKRRRTELVQKVAYFSMEAQRWRIKARNQEEIALDLRMTLQHTMMRSGRNEEEGEAQVEDAESSFVDPERVEPVELVCKACGKCGASVMMWPCRHVCVCMKCDAAVKTCPLCQALKTTSVEVFLS